MRRTHATLALVLLLAACQPAGVVPTKKASPKPEEPQVAATATSVQPSAGSATSTPAAAASPAWEAAVKLEPPAGQASVLSGKITMDPSYIVASGAGNIVASGAGNIVAAGAGNIIASGAGNLQVGGRIVSAGAGNVVAAGGGNIISGNASAIVAAGAGNIIASGAGNIVAAGAGNIISGNGSAIISGNGSAAVTRQRRLFATGQNLEPIPGAGMLVSVLSLRTHQYLSLGSYKDKDGQPQPVYSVYTNANGEYKLYLPPEESGNVMVVASPPGQTNDDRLIYNVVTDAKPHDEPIDEDVALASRYLHFSFSGRMAEVLAADQAGVDHVVQIFNEDNRLPPAFQGTFKDFLYKLNAEGKRYDVPHWADQHDVDDLATHVTDVALSYLDPKTPITKAVYAKYEGPDGEPVIQAMANSLGKVRVATQRKLAANPTFFDGLVLPFLDNCGNPAPVTMEVKKTTDPGDFMVSRYMTKNVLNGFANVGTLENLLDVEKLNPATNALQNKRMEASAYVILQAIVPIILTHEDVFDEIQRFCTREGFKPTKDPVKTPAPVPSCTPYKATPTAAPSATPTPKAT